MCFCSHKVCFWYTKYLFTFVLCNFYIIAVRCFSSFFYGEEEAVLVIKKDWLSFENQSFSYYL